MCTSPTVLVPSPWLTSGIRISVRSARTTHNFTIHRVWGCWAVGVRPVSRGHLLITSCPVAHKPSIFRGGWNSPPMFLFGHKRLLEPVLLSAAGPHIDIVGSSASPCVSQTWNIPLQLVHTSVHYITLSRFWLTFQAEPSLPEVGPQMAPEQLVGCSSGDLWHSWSGWGHSRDLHVGQSLSKDGS